MTLLMHSNQTKVSSKIILTNGDIIGNSQKLISKYGLSGLRTLDAIQLSSAVSIKHLINGAVSADKLLNDFLKAEGINVLL
jgi:hypothetical protein